MAEEEVAIHAVIEAQVLAWNRGDIVAFMNAYDDSPDTTFIGTTVIKGYSQVFERYQRDYGDSSEKMGTLEILEFCVRLLPGTGGIVEHAVATGRFQLERAEIKSNGVFSLVWKKSAVGWKIALDHTH